MTNTKKKTYSRYTKEKEKGIKTYNYAKMINSQRNNVRHYSWEEEEEQERKKQWNYKTTRKQDGNNKSLPINNYFKGKLIRLSNQKE